MVQLENKSRKIICKYKQYLLFIDVLDNILLEFSKLNLKDWWQSVSGIGQEEIQRISDIISVINTTGKLNPDFTLYDLSQKSNNLCFRKTGSETYQYYCIVKEPEYHEKAYLFFQKPDVYWICRDYIATYGNGSPYTIRNHNVVPLADNEKSLFDLIAKVDK